ncbi:hypothetical protein LJ656_23625 [Paraburkholderia sp. MMS20-SJTR3]|uniref:HPP family protein n=1 Tax=Paraburkholderia sejongensis TaxID=2886946 RepID=A0ABS8K0W9_9BURK|nr:hypothetical protein [Paraburkholderia sp. MMS20-SJTR3]MCC8395578.1 hypothetical protein [Paraburkholderia sp. MMS20-SJTR3]
MSDIAQALAEHTAEPPNHSSARYASYLPEHERDPLDARQIVLAHLLGLCTGAAIIAAATGAVCVALRVL